MSADWESKIENLLAVDWLTAGMIVKLDNQTIIEQHSREIFPSASLIKLAVLNYVLDGDFDLDEKILVADKKPVGGAGVLQLLSQKQWQLRDLLALMISVSDNFASNVLIAHFGMGSINRYLDQLAFEGTRLNRYLMDSAALKQGIDNQINASEALQLLEMALAHGPMVTSWFSHQQSRYKLPGNFDEAGSRIQVFNKTGEGNQIDHDVARFVYGNHLMDVALLTISRSQRMAVIQRFNQIGQLLADAISD